MIKKISTPDAPAAIGPYSQAMAVNGMLYTSGQLGLDPTTGDFAGATITQQAEQSLKNLGAILAQAGTSYDKIVKTTCFLADMGDFAAFNEVYAKYITTAPARSCVAVKTLPKNALVEIEAIAVIE
ncbi:MAG: RidA family protein [Clostridia bacterium]|nr:RidA family protein [Clostridia bacterium]